MEYDDRNLLKDIAVLRDGFDSVRRELAKVIVGQETVIEKVLSAMLAGGHCLLLGVPGLAKTLLVSTLGQVLDLNFKRIQFTPDLMPSDITGTEILDEAAAGVKRELRFVKGPVFTNLLLADEINRTPPKTQAAMLEAMQEKSVTSGGKRYPLPTPFFVLATQNPIEQEGTYPLPEAQLDRFMFKIEVGYPSRSEEGAVVERMARPSPVIDASPVAALEDILRARAMLEHVYLDEKIIQYILDLVIATRPGCRKELSERQAGARLDELDGLISFGASPRASIALALASRAAALLAGRAYVLPQDVKAIAPDVLRHRIVLSYEAEAENINADAVITRLLAELRTP